MALTDNLISYWKLDEASGNALDAHGANPLTDGNMVGSATGRINGGRDFEIDSAQYFTHTDNSDLSLGADTDFTFALWFRNETDSATGVLINKIVSPYAPANAEYFIDTDGGGGGRARFRVGNGSSSQIVASNTYTYQAGVWFYLVAWHDSTADKIFIQINNDTPAEAAWSSGTQNTTADFYMGGQPGVTSQYDGIIDGCGFWKRILTSGERATLYGGGYGLGYPFPNLSSGILSTSGNNAVLGLYGEYVSSDSTAHAINFVNADHVQQATSIGNHGAAWDRIVTGSFVGPATANQATAGAYMVNAIAFTTTPLPPAKFGLNEKEIYSRFIAGSGGVKPPINSPGKIGRPGPGGPGISRFRGNRPPLERPIQPVLSPTDIPFFGTGVGSADATSTATAIGNAIIAAVGSAAGTSTATGTTVAILTADGAAAGTGTAVAFALSGSPGTASATSTATAVGAPLGIGAGTAAGTSSAAAASPGTLTGVGSATGTSTATAVGASTAATAGAAAGTAAASGIAVELHWAIGASAATGTATAISSSTISGSGVGGSAGIGEALGIGASTAAALGTAASISIAIAIIAGGLAVLTLTDGVITHLELVDSLVTDLDITESLLS